MSRRASIAGCLAAAALALAAALTPGVASAQAPDNDDVGSASAVTAIPFDDVVQVAEATVEVDEPTETCAPFANTVWYAVTLPDATDVYVDTAGSNYDTAIAVWVGTSFADVELVACNDDTPAGLQAATGFAAEAGTTYLVQVGAFFEAPPDATLTVSFGPPPKGQPFIASGGIRGSLAEVYVEEYDDATATYSNRGIQVLNGSSRSKGDRPIQVSQLTVSTYEEQFDDSTGTFTWTQRYGFADLTPEQFAIDRRLSDAWVEVGVTLFGETCTDSPSGFECTELGSVDVAVDATWTGEGPVVRTRDRSSESFDGARFRYRTHVSSRSATVAGGATGDVELDFSGALGRIVSGSDGYWTWISPGSGAFGAGTMAMLTEQAAPMGVQVESSRFRGSYANAIDEQYDEVDGSYSFVDVVMNIGESRARTGRWYPSDIVSVYSSTQTFDSVTETWTVEEWYGQGDLADGFVERKLSAASATADVTLWGSLCTYSWTDDSVDCQDLGEASASVHVDWAGVGSTSTSTYRSDVRFDDGAHVRYSGRSTNRPAIANGSITGGPVDRDLVDVGGTIGKNADGYWTHS